MKALHAQNCATPRVFAALFGISALLHSDANAQAQSGFSIVGPVRSAFQLVSPAFTNGGALPAEFTCDGLQASPPLEWSNAPAGTRSFALTMHHIPEGEEKHVYWVVYNIPSTANSLPKNATNIGVRGINTVNGMTEYTPPCSQGPGPKKYTLTLYALSSEPKISVAPSAVTMDVLVQAIKDCTLATAVMNVTYDRSGKTAVAGENARGPKPGPNGKPRLMDVLPMALIPMEVLSALKLTSDEQEKLTALNPASNALGQNAHLSEQSQRDLHEKAMAILTADQRKLIEAYRENHRLPAIISQH